MVDADRRAPGRLVDPIDASTGQIEFATIYPGWYPGRTVHIHVMAHTAERTYTSQLYFPEASTDEIFPTGGDPAVLEVRPHGGGYLAVARLHIPPK
jgi:protocatechuate 3,4-dioxygenase beta subunit